MTHRDRDRIPFSRAAAGSMAVEFALVAPVLLLLLLGFVCFAVSLSVASGVQQLASEAARASVAGLSDTERSQIARDFVATHVAAYPFILPQRLAVGTAAIASPGDAFRVSLTYDISGQTAVFASLLPFVPNRIQRSAVVSVGKAL